MLSSVDPTNTMLFCRFGEVLCRRYASKIVFDGSPLRRSCFYIASAAVLDRHSNGNSETKRFASQSHSERGARPLYFQRSPPSLPPTQHTNPTHATTKGSQIHESFTPYEFLGTTSVLPRHARHLSPCLGAALAMSPLAGNLMRLGQRQPQEFAGFQENEVMESSSSQHDKNWSKTLSGIGFLANNLFFQLIRESPIHMVRNKSMPAVYLTPGIIGCLLAHHDNQLSLSSQNSTMNPINNHGGNSKRRNIDPNAVLKETLKQDFGIKSNHIHDSQWTGISLARWMDLVMAPSNYGKSSKIKGDASVTTDLCQQSLVSALWLIALWGIAPSKKSLIDYYDALQWAGITCYGDLSKSSNKDPKENRFTEEDFAPKEMEAAMNRLLEYYSSESNNMDDIGDGSEDDETAVARAFELVCAAIVLQQQQQSASSAVTPPVVVNGYFGFDGGDLKADCAEVVVREILNILLWDDSLGMVDISRLPSTACPDLKGFLHRLNENNKHHHREKATSHNNEENPNEQQDKDLGQIWFDMLSDIPHCEYLAESPNGRAYELAPTSESISKALWYLLVGKTSKGGQSWTSVHNLERFWCKQQQTKPVTAKYDCLKHQSGDGGIMEHELISLHLGDNSRAIEIRLRCDFEKASGMAAVTHLNKPRQERLLDQEQVRELQEICFRRHSKQYSDKFDEKIKIRNRLDPSLLMLCMALQIEHEIFLPFRLDNSDVNESSIVLESLSCLATPYGPDRRELKVAHTCGLFGESSDIDCEILAQSKHLLKKQILQTCRVCETLPVSGVHLLTWILQESPVVVESSSSSEETHADDDLNRWNAAVVENEFLSMPHFILENDSVLEAIEWNWACFGSGRILVTAIRWKLRKISAWQVFTRLKLHELPEIYSLMRSIRQ